MKRALLALLGLAVGLLLAEGLARTLRPPTGADLVFPVTPAGTPRGLYQAHPVLGSAPTPGFEGVVRLPGRQIPVHINQAGLRGPEPAMDRPRWLAVGDSFTLALQVAEEQSFPALLGDAMGVQVFNGGIEASGTTVALDRYRLVDDSVGVEAVLLLFFTGNDLLDNQQSSQQGGQHHGHGHGQPGPDGPDGPPPTPMGQRLAQRSYLAAYATVASRRLALARSDGFERTQLRAQLLPFSAQGIAELTRMLPHTRDALQALRDEAAIRGDRLLVAVAPPLFVVDQRRAAPTLALAGLDQPTLDEPQQAVLRQLSDLGIPACDLTPALRDAQAAGQAPYLLLDGHWSGAGHRVAAQAIEDCLRP